MKHNSHLVKLSSTPTVRIHPNSCKLLDGQEVHLKANGATIRAKVQLDAGVAEKTAVLPLGFAELPVHEFGSNLLNGLHVEIYAS